jgi:integrase
MFMTQEAVEIDISEIDRKNKRQRRIQQKTAHIKRQVKIAKAAGQIVKQEHRFAKHNALDCGVPRCSICNPTGKRQPTIQEKKLMASMDDSVGEI